MKNVLVIDDDPSILEVIRLILSEAGYEVKTSENSSIFGHLKGENPDIILLDVLLSGEDGRDIARHLKRSPQFKKIPIIMISAHPSAREGAARAGADGFIAKPFEIDELLETVEQQLKN